jgi:hypothetical protein
MSPITLSPFSTTSSPYPEPDINFGGGPVRLVGEIGSPRLAKLSEAGLYRSTGVISTFSPTSYVILDKTRVACEIQDPAYNALQGALSIRITCESIPMILRSTDKGISACRQARFRCAQDDSLRCL